MGVEEHGHVAGQELPLLGECEPLAIPPGKAALHKALHRQQLPREGNLEGRPAELLPIAVGRDAEVAHQLPNHPAAPVVVVGERNALLHRQPTCVEGGAIGAQLLGVLHIDGRELRYGRDAEGEQLRRAADRVAHEVAAQPTVPLRHDEFVFGQREVVDADGSVTGLEEPLPRQFEQRQPRLRSGQLLHRHLELLLAEPGQVGKAVDGEPLRPDADDLLQRRGKRGQRLTRQPVDEVDVDRGARHAAAGVDDLLGLRHRLDATDGRLHTRVKILHTHREAAEAELLQRGNLRRRRHPRVDLDGQFGIGRDLEPGPDGLHEPPQLRRGEVGRCATTKVELVDAAAWRSEAVGGHRNLLQQVRQVGLRHVALLRRDDVAGAVEAALLAEGDVDVEREPSLSRQSPQRGAQVALPHAFVELVGRGVGGVAGAGTVVPGAEFAMHERFSGGDAESNAKIRPTPRNPAHGIMERESHFG